MRGTSALNQLCSGKVLLGLLVVTTTTGGFTLGYFVGKSPSSPSAPAAVRQLLNEAGSVSSVSVPGPNAAGDSSPAVPVQGPSAEAKQSAIASSVPQNSPVNMESKDEKRAGLSRGQTPSGTDAPMSSVEKGIHGQKGRPQNTKESNQSASRTPPPEGGRDLSEPAGTSPGKVLYTVQAGAFRNQKDAAVLKHKLEARGYQASIRKETNAEGVVFFRVRTGEFETRKEASLVALRLKTDGLSAFATEKK